jgi:MHS family proline/betaine transporter-like MFS transporter
VGITTPAQHDEPRQISRTSLAIAGISTVVEWYDFTLYLYLATLLSRVFFGNGAAGLLATLGGFAVAYLMRPIGALAFGHLGDRHGRRPAMLGAMGLMTAAMLITALLPSHTQVGATAGILLLLIRCLMGFSVGGEYTGVVAYLLEGAEPHRRGLITSLAAAASEIGALLAAAISALTVGLLSETALMSWGWRLPFLFGALLAGSVLFARLRIEESPEFERQRRRGSVPFQPLRHALRHHRAAILRGFAISALGSVTYYVGITYVPVFLVSTSTMSEPHALQLATIAAIAVIVVTPLVGALSDRIGRRAVLLTLALLNALLPLVMFALMAKGAPGLTLACAVVLAVLAGGVSAVGAVATAEQFPGEGRLSGLALGATSATALFGGVAPYLAQSMLARTGWSAVPGAMIALVALLVAPVIATMPGTGKHD